METSIFRRSRTAKSVVSCLVIRKSFNVCPHYLKASKGLDKKVFPYIYWSYWTVEFTIIEREGVCVVRDVAFNNTECAVFKLSVQYF